jgi:hypothetical protein
MKKINLTLLVFLIGFSCMAQYKKANYFGKNGRTYGLGTRAYKLSDYSGTVMGYTFSLGRDKDGKRFFTGQEFQLIPSYKVQLEVLEESGGYKPVNFTTKAQLIYTINFGYFLLKNDNSTRKIKPYLSAALGLKFMGGVKEEYAFTDEIAADLPVAVSLNGGGGLFFYMKPRLGLKVEGGYSLQNSLTTTGLNQKDYALPNHAYASAGVVFRIIQD